MSSDDIRRSVRASRHDRSAGDAPSLGRMARMPGTGLPKGSRRSRRKDDSTRGSRISRNRKLIIKIWSVMLSALVLAILGLTVWFWLVPKMNARAAATGRPPAVTRETARAVVKYPPPSEAEALAAVKQGLGIRDPEMIAEYFRPGSSDPRTIVDFLRGLGASEGAIYRYEWIGGIATLGLPIEGVVVHSKANDKQYNRLALLTPDVAGRWKIDFDAFARTVKPTWSELLEQRAEAAQVRVYAVKDNYYNGVFINDQEWVCYGLASPDMEQILLAYCKIGSQQAAVMDRIFAVENQMTRITLEIRRVAGGEPRQFEIAKVIAMDWVEGGMPLEEALR